MLEAYQEHVMQRAAEGIAPKALNAEQVQALTELLVAPPAENTIDLVALLSDRVPAGVDDAAYIKAGFWPRWQRTKFNLL